jgi:two-component system LytT family sensor kinase
VGEILNLVGLSTGVVLYTVLLAMVVRGARRSGVKSQLDPLLLVTAVLGLIWNLCALPAYELPKVGFQGPFPFLTAAGFSALGLLPAVVVHSVLRGARDGVRGILKRSIAGVAYAVGILAALLHLTSAWAGGPLPSALGMRLLTYTFIALVVPLAAVTRGQPGSRRALWAAALATFAVSALHLSQFHEGNMSWPVELLGHHASLPLAFAILYQDYPFALADLFLKRALGLVALVILAFAAIGVFTFRSTAFAEFMRSNPRQVGLLVTLWVATALLYPTVRQAIVWFVDSVILDRPDYQALRATIGRRVQTHDDVAALMTDVCRLLAPALSAREVTWRESRTFPEDNHDETIAVVPTTEPPRYLITIGELTRGRRLLSDDLATLEAITVLVARRVDAIRITDERYERELREQEISKLATEAELRALRAQVNPHFLFNALTTIGYLIQAAPARALQTLMRLTALLRAVLRSEGEYTTLGRELEMIESYLDIERARFEHRLRVMIDVPGKLRNIRVPPLVLQPIVENAVKHGIAQLRLGGEVRVRARLDSANNGPSQLSLVVQDTGAGATDAMLQQGRKTGVGLRNVERRLVCQYGTAASLSIHSVPGEGTTVEVRLPADVGVTSAVASRVVM